MFLGNIPDGVAAMIDANILVYHRTYTPGLTDVVISFLERVEQQAIAGFTSTVLVAEAIHRVMLVEVAQAHSLPAAGIVNRLKQRPDLVKAVSRKSITTQVLDMNISIHEVTPQLVERAEKLITKHGLLTNDSITLAVMEHLGITDLATNDDDFDAVPGLTIWKPR